MDNRFGAGQYREEGEAGSRKPRTREQIYVVGLAAALILLCSLFAAWVTGLRELVSQHGVNAAYLEITNAILGQGQVPAPKHFWGLPYAVATVAWVGHVSPVTGLYLISVVSSLAATWLVTRIWGTWVGVGFTVCNWTWIQFSAFGGSEPLFVLLLLLALAQARLRRYLAAVLLASLATTVRPLGIFLVLVLLIATWRERGIRWALVGGLAAVGIALLYVAPLIRLFHDPLASLHTYQQTDWGGGAAVTVPLKALVLNYSSGTNISNAFIKHVKLAFVLLHIGALIGLAASPALRRRISQEPVMAGFALTYSAFILTYNAPTWALSIYPRLLIPVLPFFLWLYERWLPRKWPIWMALAIVTLVLACGSGLGFNRARQLLHFRLESGVGDGNRTHNVRSHSPVLCQLSYSHRKHRL